MPHDEFELLLERCSERLAEISLSVPALESGAPRRPVYSLAPSPPAPAKPAASPPKPIALPPLPEPPKPAAQAPIEEPEEDEVFPPVRMSPRTPPPSVPLWRAQSTPTPEPAPKAPPASRRPAAAAAVAAVLTFGVWWARRPAADLDIEVGDADAMTVRPEKRDLLVARGNELVDLAQDGRMLERKPLAAPVDSLRWSQGSLWSADGRTASIMERADDGRTTAFPLNHVPGAFYVNDKYLWTAEKNGRVLHQFLISRSILGAILQPIDSFDLNGISAGSFMIDDSGTLWLVDETTRRLYRFRLQNGSYKPVASAPLSPFVGPDGKLRGMTIENGAVWLMSRPAGRARASLRRIVLSRLDWSPS